MGLRYTRIDTDAVAFNDEQNMNVLEAPIGVKFAGTFEATGWKLVPSYGFTIVPQLGDKEVEAFGTAGDITILSGGLFSNVLGVEAVKDNMSFRSERLLWLRPGRSRQHAGQCELPLPLLTT